MRQNKPSFLEVYFRGFGHIEKNSYAVREERGQKNSYQVWEHRVRACQQQPQE